MKIAIIGADEALKNQIMVLLAEHAPHIETKVIDEPDDLIDSLSYAQYWSAFREAHIALEDFTAQRVAEAERWNVYPHHEDFIKLFDDVETEKSKPHWQSLNTKYGGKRR